MAANTLILTGAGTASAPSTRVRQEDGTPQLGVTGTPFSTTADLDTPATSIHAPDAIDPTEFNYPTQVQAGTNGFDELQQFIGIMCAAWLCPPRGAITRLKIMLTSMEAFGGPG